MFSNNKKEGEIAIYKNGMQIRAADTKLQSGFQCYMVFSVMAMLAFWTLIALGTYVSIVSRGRAVDQ